MIQMIKSDRHLRVNEMMTQASKRDVVYNENLLTKPILLPSEIYETRKSNFKEITYFFNVAKDLFQDCVINHYNSALTKLLINDSIERLSYKFYKDLPQEIWTIPLFFRTDESKAGRVFEIQCPGSGWGDLILLEELYKELYPNQYIQYDSLANFNLQVQRLTNKKNPSLLHLLDNSSNPASMNFLLARSNPPLNYWGISPDVNIGQCDFIRSHSVYGLISENLFFKRVKKAAEGELKFDLPPLLIFDQKMIFCLPFLDETKEYFSDSIRQILTYTYPLSDKGFREETGEWVTIESFLSRPRNKRRYFLKYGGCDTTVNWGSRGVYRLDSTNAKIQIENAIRDYHNGRPWIIQPEHTEKESVEYYDQFEAESKKGEFNSKYSTFYGPYGLLGMKTYHRKHAKVHGQIDSISGLAYPSH